MKRKRHEENSSGNMNTSAKKVPLTASSKKNVNAPTKKLSIKIKDKPALPDNYEDNTWSILQNAVSAVNNKQPVNTGFEELYKYVEDLVDHQMSENLYRRLEKEIEQHTVNELKKLMEATENTSSERFLVIINNSWSDFCQQLLLIRQIFLVLDRKFALQRQDIKSIWDLGLSLFSKHIASITEIDEKLRAGLFSVIESDRRGETVDKVLIKSLLRMQTSLQMYEKHFEKSFLAATATFYERESERYIEEFQVAEFLKHFEDRIEEENQRVIWYLDEATRKPLIHIVENVTLAKHADSLIEKGYDALMDGDKIDSLKRMYSLFSRVDALGKIKDAWNGYIKKRGGEIILDEQNDKTIVDNLLNFKIRMDTILKTSFNSDDEFLLSLREAFEYFINLRQNAPAELLAKFLDSKLRVGKSTKVLSELELETLQDRVMEVFRFINGKDVFEAFYKKDLAKRLLLGKSTSVDGEKAMISKLKTECGANFTSKLEGMFKDIDLSKDIVNEFKQTPEYSSYVKDSGLESKVYILTTGFWPPYPSLKCNLPPLLSDFQQAFQAFYLNKYSGRRLLWQHSLTQCTIKAIFPKGKKELGVSLFQTLALLMFNEGESHSFNDLVVFTGLEPNELKRTLQSLACGKIRILTKEPAGRIVAETDTFQINSNFATKSVKINVNSSVQVKETKQEQKKTQESVFKDRQYQVDAAIVRIMKTRKTLSHNLLISELFNQLKFPVKATDLKKRIESLIEREYIERDNEDNTLYNYLA
uniref:Cullin-4 n=1 Tax=Arcella intermedia TaxID=1963864 RepID=A0A6B2KYG7_9EUKA